MKSIDATEGRLVAYWPNRGSLAAPAIVLSRDLKYPMPRSAKNKRFCVPVAVFLSQPYELLNPLAANGYAVDDDDEPSTAPAVSQWMPRWATPTELTAVPHTTFAAWRDEAARRLRDERAEARRRSFAKAGACRQTNRAARANGFFRVTDDMWARSDGTEMRLAESDGEFFAQLSLRINAPTADGLKCILEQAGASKKGRK